MDRGKERLFHYDKMFEEIQRITKMNQRQISELINCTEVHLSNIKHKKATMPVSKILDLVNRFSLSLDDFVYNRESDETLDVAVFGKLEQDEVLFLLDCLKLYRKKKEQRGGKKQLEIQHYEKVVGKNIKKIRKEKKISVKYMSNVLVMKEESYRNIESGTFGTTMDNYILIAGTFDVPVSLLFSGVVENKKDVVEYYAEQMFQGMDREGKEKTQKNIIKMAELIHEMMQE